MRVVKQGFTILMYSLQPVQELATIARTCYQSNEVIEYESNKRLVERLIKSGHHSQLEHLTITIKFTTDRGVSHELVRHRLAAYSQESTRWCNYSKGKFGKNITFILPVWLYDVPEEDLQYVAWYNACKISEDYYFHALNKLKWNPEQARCFLNNSLKTEIVCTMNVREWRWVLALRCAQVAHPQMRQLMRELLQSLRRLMPTLFETLPKVTELPAEMFSG